MSSQGERRRNRAHFAALPRRHRHQWTWLDMQRTIALCDCGILGPMPKVDATTTD